MGLGLCWVRRLKPGCLCRKLEDTQHWQTPCLWAFIHRELRKVAWAQCTAELYAESAKRPELLADGRQRCKERLVSSALEGGTSRLIERTPRPWWVHLNLRCELCGLKLLQWATQK